MLTVDRLRGSSLRCLLLTGLPRIETAELLTDLAKPSGAVISPDVDTWMPSGFMDWKETTLLDNDDFLDSTKRKDLSEWGLPKTRRANKPNWDIVSSRTT